MHKGAPQLHLDLNPLASYLQVETERERLFLVRQLHDGLGGLIVAALMDLDWVERHLDDADQSQTKLHHVRQALTTAIDLKRALIENLRPTLLDNFGLFAALKWHLEQFCAAASLKCSVTLDPDEPQLSAESSISAFRFVQEALRLCVRSSSPTAIGIHGRISESRLRLQLSHDGKCSAYEAEPEFASMSHRITRVGGVLSVTPQVDGGLCWSVEIPAQANS